MKHEVLEGEKAIRELKGKRHFRGPFVQSPGTFRAHNSLCIFKTNFITTFTFLPKRKTWKANLTSTPAHKQGDGEFFPYLPLERHFLPSRSKMYPSRQEHLKLPLVLRQTWLHIPGISHSLISGNKIVKKLQAWETTSILINRVSRGWYLL